jgi:hypothetical protein
MVATLLGHGSGHHALGMGSQYRRQSLSVSLGQPFLSDRPEPDFFARPPAIACALFRTASLRRNEVDVSILIDARHKVKEGHDVAAVAYPAFVSVIVNKDVA